MLLYQIQPDIERMTLGNDTDDIDPERCPKEGVSEQYWIYLTVSGALLVVVILFVGWPAILYKLFRITLTLKRYRRAVKRSYTNSRVKYVKEVALGEHTIGKLMIIISLMINFAYFSLYWKRTYLVSDICLDQFDPEWRFELACTIYFILYFLWRLFGGLDDLAFWLNTSTVVDLLTIPHIFVSLARNRDWVGLRFLRILWFNNFVDLLNHLPTSNRYLILQAVLTIMTFIITFWLACSGAIHLLEVTGDPWNEFNNRRSDLEFQDYMYFIIVTVSTVGYGDVSPQTEAGRFFIIVLIILSVFLIGYLTPTISKISSTWSQYTGSYIQVADIKHVVVTGYITGKSVKHFLRNFLHPDWNDDYTKVLFLHPNEPDYTLQAVLKKHFRSIKYYKGSVLSNKDMARVNMDTASAAIILTPNYSQNPKSEDESNIMRIISIKNAYKHTRIIAQVLQMQSLRQVLSLSYWDSSKDTIICKNKLKLGLMAQNCLCPGISTLLSNLVYPISSSDLVAKLSWHLEYCKGAENELYRKELPESFIGKTYEYIAKLCFMRYELLFIAIDYYSEETQKYLTYMPPFNCTIRKGMYGYFVAQNDGFVSNALEHLGIEELFRITDPASEQPLGSIPLLTMEGQISDSCCCNPNVCYHCAERDFHAALVKKTDVQDHVILCTFNLQKSNRLSLQSFVSPLRACSLKEHELKPIVIIGNKDCIQLHWYEIATFDQIFVIDGDPVDKCILIAANVAYCSSCVILGSTTNLDTHSALIDKQSILCSLILTSSSFKCDVAANKIKSGKGINKIAELYKDKNARFLDLNDKDCGSFVTSHTFAQGECMSNSIFDALVAVTFFNPGVTALFEMLVTGGDHSITYGNYELLSWPRFSQISLQEENYKRFEGLNFSELFNYQLEKKMLCIGISRVMENQAMCDHLKRYIITLPYNLALKPDDNIIVLISK